ncbi:MAG: hypothetical protein ABJA35_16210 [Parafilimonas sp.]
MSGSSFVGLPTRKLSLDKPWKNNRLLLNANWRCSAFNAAVCRSGVNIGLVDASILADNLTKENLKP